MVVSGLAQNSFGSTVTVYPNPAAHLVTIDLEKEYREVTVAVFDLKGTMLLDLFFNNTREVPVQLAGFAAGLYLISIRSENRSVTARMVVE